jgi:hypothetical protein
MREIMIKKGHLNKNIRSRTIANQEQRALFWTPVRKIKDLDFYIQQIPQKFIFKSGKKSKKEEFKKICDYLFKKKINAYYKEIGLEPFRKLGHYSVKVLIPNLQSLYIDEKAKVVNIERLKNVADYFSIPQQNRVINSVPHPFL